MAPVGVAFDGRNTIPEARAQALAAEAAGASSLWVSSHLFLRDPFASAAAILQATQKVRVALLAVSPQMMHPVHIAMAAATLDEIAPGRVAMCIGTGAPGDLADAGVEARRPLATLAETVAVLRALLSGEQARYEGEIFRLRGRRMVRGAKDVPVFIAASRPKSLELAGRIADGVVLSNSASVEFVRWSLDHFDRGAQGRKVTRAGLVYALATAEPADALNRFRRQLGITLRAEHHAMNLQLAGSSLDQRGLRDAMEREDWVTFERLVTDDTVRRHTACGTAAEVRARLEAYRGAGLDEVVLGGLYGAEETQRTADAAFGRGG